MLAASLPISLAATNIAKALLVLFGLLSLLPTLARRDAPIAWKTLWTPRAIALMLAALALSAAYTSAAPHEALNDVLKYAKLLAIPLLLLVVRSRREALIALAVYGCAQGFVLASSYLLSAGVALPWVYKTVLQRTSVGAVFSSYLDQSIMTAGMAALAWHLRHEIPGRHGAAIGAGLVALCVINVMLLLPGRSGQVALLAALMLALWWALPGRARPAAVALPLLLVAVVLASSTSFRDRTAAVITEARAYKEGDRSPTSSGLRLGYWHRALQAIGEQPLIGHGVASWNHEFRRLEGPQLPDTQSRLRNPHQEYLQWMVQLGVVGLALFLGLLAAMLHDTRRFEPPLRHAAWSMVAIFAVACQFNSTLYDALIGDYFCAMFGLLLAAGLATRRPPAG